MLLKELFQQVEFYDEIDNQLKTQCPKYNLQSDIEGLNIFNELIDDWKSQPDKKIDEWKKFIYKAIEYKCLEFKKQKISTQSLDKLELANVTSKFKTELTEAAERQPVKAKAEEIDRFIKDALKLPQIETLILKQLCINLKSYVKEAMGLIRLVNHFENYSMNLEPILNWYIVKDLKFQQIKLVSDLQQLWSNARQQQFLTLSTAELAFIYSIRTGLLTKQQAYKSLKLNYRTLDKKIELFDCLFKPIGLFILEWKKMFNNPKNNLDRNWDSEFDKNQQNCNS